MALQTWALFVAVSILPVMSPGPAVLLAISNSIRFGPTATFFSALGNTLGLTILGFAVAFGLAALLTASAAAFTIVKIAGALYLLYLGLRLWRNGKALEFDPVTSGPVKSPMKLFLEALLLALTNPKGLVLVAALIPPFVDHNLPALPQVAILSLTFAVMCFFNHLFLAFAGSRARRLLSSERRLLAVRRVLGSLFMGFGVALALTSR
jgi:threonine/homoserine/homoserine lactone efflux protein